MKLLHWALVLLLISVVFGVLGFVVHVGYVVTKALFFVTLAGAAVVAVSHKLHRGDGTV